LSHTERRNRQNVVTEEVVAGTGVKVEVAAPVAAVVEIDGVGVGSSRAERI
jgi:hypothetical protein